MGNGIGHIRAFCQTSWFELSGIINILLGTLCNPCHGAHCLDRICACSRLTRQHDGTGSLIDGICHIGGLCTGRSRVLDHRIQHLGCGDNRFARFQCHTNQFLLNNRHFLQRNLHTHVTTGYHDTVCHTENLLTVLHSLHIFNFRNNMDILSAFFFQNLTNFQNVIGSSCKGSCNKIIILLSCKHDILIVLLADKGHLQFYSRNIHTLMIGDETTVFHLTDNLLTFDFLHFHADESIINQNGISRFYVFIKLLISNAYDLCISNDIFRSKNESLSFFQFGFSALNISNPDLWSLGIQKCCHREFQFFPKFFHHIQSFFLFLMTSMGKIHSRHGHSFQHQLAQYIFIIRRWSQGTYNLRFSHLPYIPFPHTSIRTILM